MRFYGTLIAKVGGHTKNSPVVVNRMVEIYVTKTKVKIYLCDSSYMYWHKNCHILDIVEVAINNQAIKDIVSDQINNLATKYEIKFENFDLKLKTMEKKMYALTYCYGGTDNTNPYATTIAVSTDIEKLKAEMEKCVAEDCEIDEDDEWADDKNYIVDSKYDTEVTLQHRENTNLYTTYKIHSVDCLG